MGSVTVTVTVPSISGALLRARWVTPGMRGDPTTSTLQRR